METAFYDLKTPEEKVQRAIQQGLEGLCPEAVARVEGVPSTTVQGWLAGLEARFPEVLRYHTGRVSPYEVLHRLATMTQDDGVPCAKCTPFFEAILWLERQYISIYEAQDDRLMRLEAKMAYREEHELADEALRDAYVALLTAHETLQLEYQDLETVYHATVRVVQHHREDE